MAVDIEEMFATMGLVRFGAVPICQTKDFFDYVNRNLPHSLILNCVSTKTTVTVDDLVRAYNRSRHRGRARVALYTNALPSGFTEIHVRAAEERDLVLFRLISW